jgi:hypothetical protein
MPFPEKLFRRAQNSCFIRKKYKTPAMPNASDGAGTVNRRSKG